MKIYGIFVGIDKYEDKRITQLKYAEKDAEDLYCLFDKNIQEENKNLYLLNGEKATKSNIFKTIGEDIAEIINNEDMFIFYFAGHGTPETLPNIDKYARYLAPFETRYKNIFSTAIDMEDELSRLLSRISCNKKLIFIDACFSGRAGGRTFKGYNLLMSNKEFRYGIDFSEIDLGSGCMIFSACQTEQVAYEDDRINHGIFTYFLKKQLTSNEEGKTISLMLLYDKLSSDIRSYTDGAQCPMFKGHTSYFNIPLLKL